jgi:hypothetical protein
MFKRSHENLVGHCAFLVGIRTSNQCIDLEVINLLIIHVWCAVCAGSLSATSTIQSFQSPGFPTGYPSDSSYCWSISAAAGELIWVKFTNVSLGNYSQHSDSLGFYSGKYFTFYN